MPSDFNISSDEEDNMASFKNPKLNKHQKRLVEQMKTMLQNTNTDGDKKGLTNPAPKGDVINSPSFALRDISKRIINTGKAPMAESCQAAGGGFEYPKETKFIFHYCIKTLSKNGSEPIVMDDTRKYGKTMELYSGKEFQLDFWEHCLATMGIDEVASFTVPVKRLLAFPAVNKKLRDYMLNKTKEKSHHCCGMIAMQEQLAFGYEDLDEFMKNPQPLEFMFNLLDIVLPEQNLKETWVMNYDEKEKKIPELRTEGNALYVKQDYMGAAQAYSKALNLLDQLCINEKPQDTEWVKFDNRKATFYLNLAQAQYKLSDFYSAIDSATECISREKGNHKAFYRRAQAYGRTWEVEKAVSDYNEVIRLFPDMTKTCNAEIQLLNKRSEEQELNQKKILSNKIKITKN